MEFLPQTAGLESNANFKPSFHSRYYPERRRRKRPCRARPLPDERDLAQSGAGTGTLRSIK